MSICVLARTLWRYVGTPSWVCIRKFSFRHLELSAREVGASGGGAMWLQKLRAVSREQLSLRLVDPKRAAVHATSTIRHGWAAAGAPLPRRGTAVSRVAQQCLPVQQAKDFAQYSPTIRKKEGPARAQAKVRQKSCWSPAAPGGRAAFRSQSDCRSSRPARLNFANHVLLEKFRNRTAAGTSPAPSGGSLRPSATSACIVTHQGASVILDPRRGCLYILYVSGEEVT